MAWGWCSTPSQLYLWVRACHIILIFDNFPTLFIWERGCHVILSWLVHCRPWLPHIYALNTRLSLHCLYNLVILKPPCILHMQRIPFQGPVLFAMALDLENSTAQSSTQPVTTLSTAAWGSKKQICEREGNCFASMASHTCLSQVTMVSKGILVIQRTLLNIKRFH